MVGQLEPRGFQGSVLLPCREPGSPPCVRSPSRTVPQRAVAGPHLVPLPRVPYRQTPQTEVPFTSWRRRRQTKQAAASGYQGEAGGGARGPTTGKRPHGFGVRLRAPG